MAFWNKKGKKDKKAPTRKKASEKQAKRRIVNKKSSKNDRVSDAGFEEVIIRCPSCGRDFKIVKSSQFSTEGMLCQRCATGGASGFDGEDE